MIELENLRIKGYVIKFGALFDSHFFFSFAVWLIQEFTRL